MTVLFHDRVIATATAHFVLLPIIYSGVCRYLIVLIAAILGAFTSNTSNSDGKTYVFVDSKTGSPRIPEPLPYPICSQRNNGISPLDLCVLSSLAYSNKTNATSDAKNWFLPAKASVSLIYFGSVGSTPEPSPHVAVFNISGDAPFAENGTIVISVRGSKALADFAEVC